jgi:uncharacterized protein
LDAGVWRSGGALLAGFLGALTGIGGVILVPALTDAGGVPVDIAIGTTLFALLFSAPVAAYAAIRRVGLEPAQVIPLCLAAAAGAICGAATLALFPANLLRLLVAAAAVAAGAQALYRRERSAPPVMPGASSLVALGLVVGWASAVTGTGGPILPIPILLFLDVATPSAIGLALAAHVPIVATASAVNVYAGRVDVPLGATLGVLLVAGTLAGIWMFTRLSGRQLTLCVAMALIAVGCWYAYATLAGSGTSRAAETRQSLPTQAKATFRASCGRLRLGAKFSGTRR